MLSAHEFVKYFGQDGTQCQMVLQESQSIVWQSSPPREHDLAVLNRKKHFECPTVLFQKRPFVHNSVCSQVSESLFAILVECSQFCLRAVFTEILEEIHDFLVLEGGG